MGITTNAIPPTTPPTMETLIEGPATLAESESCAFGAAVEEVMLGEFVVVAMTVGLPVEVMKEFDVPISTPGPISGLPKNVGVKGPKTSAKKFRTTQGLRVVGVPVILELSYFFHKCRKADRSRRTASVTSMRVH